MCGINGIYNFSNVTLENAESLVDQMNDCIRHRGPDDSGLWKNETEGIYFGHRRLSIIDLSPAGHQPMISAKGNVIIFNGEIYNYKEIKEHVKENKFNSSSDTEVLLFLYEKYGEECLQYLNGIFAFAIWNNEKKELFIARDRAGKKPVYYSIQNGIFSFSSEIKALLTLPWIKAELDETALYHFLTFNQLPPPLTMFQNIFKLEAAAKMKIAQNGKTGHSVYWEVNYSSLAYRNEKELENTIFSALQKSIDYRMVSDVPVGAFLSGGVDSSAIVALMSAKTSYPVKTYSIGFENSPGYDELHHARKISQLFKTDHYEKIVTPKEIMDFLPKVIDIFDEPLADTTCIPIYFISQLAKQNGTIVVLTGDGPDELFIGYNNWMKYLHAYPYYHLFSGLPSFIKKGIGSFINEDTNSPVTEILVRAAKNQELFWGGAKSFKESTKRIFLSDNYKKRTAHLNSQEIILQYKNAFLKIKGKAKNNDDGAWMCYLGFKFMHPNRYLFRADRLGMAHSIEARMPFLDYEFVNLALSIPTSLKIKNKIPKYILKKSLERILSKDVLYRKKQGFNVPIKEWGNEIMLDYVESNMEEFCKSWDLFSKTGIEIHIDEIKKGNKNFTNNLWTIYFLMSWLKKWMKN
jgi:asparagine synthase (glutamine-hydrolysing)